jgi:hypothetical protein
MSREACRSHLSVPKIQISIVSMNSAADESATFHQQEAGTLGDCKSLVCVLSSG